MFVKQFENMDEGEQFEALYNSFKDELYALTVDVVKRRIMSMKGTTELTDAEEQLAKEFYDSMKEEIERDY